VIIILIVGHNTEEPDKKAGRLLRPGLLRGDKRRALLSAESAGKESPWLSNRKCSV